MRAEKKLIADDLAKQLGGSPFVLLTDYAGMSVGNFAALRKKLRGVGAEYHVVKNTMLRHAAKAAGLGEFDGSLAGMTAIVLGNEKADQLRDNKYKERPRKDRRSHFRCGSQLLPEDHFCFGSFLDETQ